MKLIITAIIVFLTIGITLSMAMLDQLGIERNYLFIGLGALAITSLVAFQSVFQIVMILIMSLVINMPVEILNQYYLDRDIMMVVIIMMVIFPLLYREFTTKK